MWEEIQSNGSTDRSIPLRLRQWPCRRTSPLRLVAPTNKPAGAWPAVIQVQGQTEVRRRIGGSHSKPADTPGRTLLNPEARKCRPDRTGANLVPGGNETVLGGGAHQSPAKTERTVAPATLLAIYSHTLTHTVVFVVLPFELQCY